MPGAEYTVNDFDEAFNKMSRSAGVSEIAEVVERFRTQKLTSSSLHDQQSTAETDVREMGVLKEDLERPGLRSSKSGFRRRPSLPRRRIRVKGRKSIKDCCGCC